jgi:hypothetical protein
MKHTLLQLSVTKNLILLTVLREHKNTGEKYFEYFCDYQQIKNKRLSFFVIFKFTVWKALRDRV